MKKTCMYAACLLAALAVTGCSSEEDVISNNDSAEIKVAANVAMATVTKAPVMPGDKFKAAITAFESRNTPNWSSTPAWTNSITLIASDTPEERRSLDKPKPYPTGNGTYVYMAAWHPNIPSEKGIVTFKKTGTEDVMWGGTVSGNIGDPVDAFHFEHELTQLNFQLAATEEYLTGDQEKRIVKGIQVVDARYPESMEIGTGDLEFADEENIEVPSVKSTELTNDMQSVGKPLMVKAMDEVKIVILYGNGSRSKEIPIYKSGTREPLMAEQGYSHQISLLFAGDDEEIIYGSGVVDEWLPGADGSGVVTPN